MSPKPNMTASITIANDVKPSFSRSSTDSSTESNESSPIVARYSSSSSPKLLNRIRNRSCSPAARTTQQSPSESRSRTTPQRTDSNSSSFSAPRRSRSQKRHSGTFMQVGRNSNDWLFGGFSFTETLKGLLSPTQSSHDDSESS